MCQCLLFCLLAFAGSFRFACMCDCFCACLCNCFTLAMFVSLLYFSCIEYNPLCEFLDEVVFRFYLKLEDVETQVWNLKTDPISKNDTGSTRVQNLEELKGQMVAQEGALWEVPYCSSHQCPLEPQLPEEQELLQLPPSQSPRSEAHLG